MVLHDLNGAAVHADRIVLMNQSEIVAGGRPREVLQEALLYKVYAQRMVIVDHPCRNWRYGVPWSLFRSDPGPNRHCAKGRRPRRCPISPSALFDQYP